MNVMIEWIYRTSKGIETVFRSDEMPAEQAYKVAQDIDKMGRAKTITFTDQYDSSWTMKEMKHYLTEIEGEPHNVIVYFDGGYDRQTAIAGLGCAIYFEQNGKPFRVRKNAQTVGLKSNNESEYAALQLSITELELLNVQNMKVRFIGDSQVVINQMNGEWAVLEPELLSWADRIDNKLKDLGIHPKYEHVSRKINTEADHLATQAIHGIEIIAQTELLAE
ncbi:reverse transcriptase-like protein [Rummeliibacillus sp. SL167]|uniref:reverse transcriptase-like protein n=1 Tax=Rummeliibacillus sp. SL167 TaxID=2579792 RepID=UPI0011B4E52E|nr:reverse transcriptase-like protein [Rummeliibacillus sp. SL167]